MSTSIKISVVIPSQNRAHTLCRCIESVLNQTRPATEIIVVDDGSTDNTKDIVKEYEGRGVIYVRLANAHGAQAARNFGVKVASCEWIAFQDSDDLWLPNKLAIQTDALRLHNFNKNIVVHGNGIKLDENTNKEYLLHPPLTDGFCQSQLLLRPAPMFPALLASKEAILEAGGLDDNCPSYQEWDTAICLAKRCEFIHIQEALFTWIWHAGETISKDYRRDVLGFAYVIRKHKQEILAIHGQRAWRRLNLHNVIRALGASLWKDAKYMLEDENWHLSISLARLAAKRKFFPKGASKVLRLISH